MLSNIVIPQRYVDGVKYSINNTYLHLKHIKHKFGFSSSISFYHPNEIYACQFTEQILEWEFYFTLLPRGYIRKKS